MKIVIASSERFIGCAVHALVRAGHQVCGVISPFKGIYDRQFDGLRFIFYDWVGWDIRKACERFNVPLRIANRLSEGTIQSFLKAEKPDLLVVFGWPNLISDQNLSLFRLGGINIHPSLLPKLRGADPLFALVDNYKLNFGISFHRLTSELDSGNLFFQQPLDFSPNHTYDDLYLKIIRAIHRYLPHAITNMIADPKGWQQNGEPTWVQAFRPSARFLDPGMTVSVVARRARACFSHHPMVGSVGGQLFSFRSCQAFQFQFTPAPEPGTVLGIGLKSLKVRFSDAFALLEDVRFPDRKGWQGLKTLLEVGRPLGKLNSKAETLALWKTHQANLERP